LNAQLQRRLFSPLHWFLALFGWTLRARYDNYERKNGFWRWSLTRNDEELYANGKSSNKDGPQHLTLISSESYWFRLKSWSIYFHWTVDTSGNELKLHIAIPVICTHYLTFQWAKDCWFKRCIRPRAEYENVSYGLKINEYAISWDWRQSEMCWSSDGSTGYHAYLGWDSFRERAKHETVFSYVSPAVAFTEPAYRKRPASEHIVKMTYTETLMRYRRPWNRNRTTYYVDISFQGGKLDDPIGRLQHPPAFSGKGENSWDCDDDGIWGCVVEVPQALQLLSATKAAITQSPLVPIDTVTLNRIPDAIQDINANAIEQYIAMVQKDRVRRG
jgi:hypothetical protein